MDKRIESNSKFIRYIRYLANEGEPGAQFVLVYYLSSRAKAGKYRGLCLRLLQKLSKQGNSLADYALGNWHIHGLGVRKNYGKAFRYFLSAAQKGHPSAQYDVGVSYEKGEVRKKISRRLSIGIDDPVNKEIPLDNLNWVCATNTVVVSGKTLLRPNFG